MKIVVFAGGVGTRLWPLSRRNSPKQFGKIVGDQSTLQQTVYRLLPQFKASDIYIATGKRYEQIVLAQLPEIPKENFIFEPEMRDVGPAIGLVSAVLDKESPEEPMAILWSDHLVKQEDKFRQSLKAAEEAVKAKKTDFIFIAQKPRFANQNIGWIEIGNVSHENNGVPMYEFKRLRYRPALEEAQKFFKDTHFVWNLGYFVTTPSLLMNLFSEHVSSTYSNLLRLKEAWRTEKFDQTLQEIYPKLEKISFDDAILQKLIPGSVRMDVILDDLGWSDVGAWEALKEALSQTEEDNVTHGNVLLEGSRDSLVYNYDQKKIGIGIDLNGLLVINTEDVLLICPKQSVPKIKKLVESFAGTPKEHLT